MFRAVLLLFLILVGVVMAWLPNDVFEEDVINKYRTEQAMLNQELNQPPSGQTLALETQKKSKRPTKKAKKGTPTSSVTPITKNGKKLQNGKIPTGNAIESNSRTESLTAVSPPVDDRSRHPLYDLFEKTDVPSQFYDIDNQESTTLVSNNGALINIPSNCFLQQDGSIVEGNVIIEVKELESKSEYLFSNVTTNTFNGLLSSDGLIYFNAYADEQELKVAPQKLVYVELATELRDGDKRAFFAELDESGKIWWAKSTPQVNRMLALPLEEMAFNEMDLDPKLQQYLMQKQFEQTFIATRAFEERLKVLQKFQKLFPIEEVVNMYVRSIEADMKEPDSKIAYYFSQLAKKQKDNIALAAKMQKLSKQFTSFATERYTKPLYHAPYGIDLSQPDAYDQLKGKGMSVFTANMYLQMYQCKQYLIAQRNEEGGKMTQKRKAKNTFLIHHTGWFSINEFLPQDTPKRKLMAQMNSNPDAHSSLYLVLDGYNTVVEAQKDKTGNYHFKNLPLGASGHLVALSFQHEQPFIDVQAIKIGEKYLHSLQMRPTTIEMMQYEISQLDYDRKLSASL